MGHVCTALKSIPLGHSSVPFPRDTPACTTVPAAEPAMPTGWTLLVTWASPFSPIREAWSDTRSGHFQCLQFQNDTELSHLSRYWIFTPKFLRSELDHLQFLLCLLHRAKIITIILWVGVHILSVKLYALPLFALKNIVFIKYFSLLCFFTLYCCLPCSGVWFFWEHHQKLVFAGNVLSLTCISNTNSLF